MQREQEARALQAGDLTTLGDKIAYGNGVTAFNEVVANSYWKRFSQEARELTGSMVALYCLEDSLQALFA